MSNVLPLRPQAATEGPWYTQRWPWLLMLGPFLVVIAASYTGWVAFKYEDALVVGDYYQQGKAINQDLRRDVAASALGLDATLGYDAVRGVLTGKIESHGKPYGMPLTLHLAHATQPEKDIKLEVRPDADGKFSAPLPMFERSRWQVVAEDGARQWRLGATWIWPGQHGIELRADAPK